MAETSPRNVFRYVSGDTKTQPVAVASATVIQNGDVLVLDSATAKPASLLSDGGTLVANQEAVHDVFLGIAMEASADGETKDITCATAGVFRMPATDTTTTDNASDFTPGELVGIDEATGTTISAVRCIGVATANLSIGRAARLYSQVLFADIEIVSTLHRGGPQAMA